MRLQFKYVRTADTMDLDESDGVLAFREKSRIGSGWLNGGFLVCDPKVQDYIGDDEIMLEREPWRDWH